MREMAAPQWGVGRDSLCMATLVNVLIGVKQCLCWTLWTQRSRMIRNLTLCKEPAETCIQFRSWLAREVQRHEQTVRRWGRAITVLDQRMTTWLLTVTEDLVPPRLALHCQMTMMSTVFTLPTCQLKTLPAKLCQVGFICASQFMLHVVLGSLTSTILIFYSFAAIGDYSRHRFSAIGD